MPFDRGDTVSMLHERGQVLSQDHGPEGTSISARIDGELTGPVAACLRAAAERPPSAGR